MSQQIQAHWEAAAILALNPVSSSSLDLFERQHGVMLPTDLRAYFNRLNGTGAKYEEAFIRFTFLAEFSPLPILLADWDSASPYQQLLLTIAAPEHVFVFTDYIFFLFAYAIRLYPTSTAQNEVYILCGDNYQLLDTSFTTFLALYLRDDDALYFADE